MALDTHNALGYIIIAINVTVTNTIVTGISHKGLIKPCVCVCVCVCPLKEQNSNKHPAKG